MKVILAVVMSIDGKITHWDEQGTVSWNSVEDQQYFKDLVAGSEVVVLGRSTYEVARKGMRHAPGRLRVVLTSTPEKYVEESIQNQLEFTSESPKALVARLTEGGHKQVLLTGGEQIYQAFLRDNLVSEVWLTIEPKIFGVGKSFSGSKELDLNLRLIDMEKLNDAGTLLAKYEVL